MNMYRTLKHLVACGRYVEKPEGKVWDRKAAYESGWQKNPASLKTVNECLAGWDDETEPKRLGVKPMALGCFVLDIDLADPNEFIPVFLKQYGLKEKDVLPLNTLHEGRCHLVVRTSFKEHWNGKLAYFGHLVWGNKYICVHYKENFAKLAKFVQTAKVTDISPKEVYERYEKDPAETEQEKADEAASEDSPTDGFLGIEFAKSSRPPLKFPADKNDPDCPDGTYVEDEPKCPGKGRRHDWANKQAYFCGAADDVDTYERILDELGAQSDLKRDSEKKKFDTSWENGQSERDPTWTAWKVGDTPKRKVRGKEIVYMVDENGLAWRVGDLSAKRREELAKKAAAANGEDDDEEKPYVPPVVDPAVAKEDYGLIVELKRSGLQGVLQYLSAHKLDALRYNTANGGVEVRLEKGASRERWGLKTTTWNEWPLVEEKAMRSMWKEAKEFCVVGEKRRQLAMGWDSWKDTMLMHAKAMKMHNDWQEFWKGVKPAATDKFLFKAFLKCYDLPKDAKGRSRKKLTRYEKDALRLAFSTMVRRQQAVMEGNTAGVHARVSLCLRGPKRCGKSSFFGQCFPPESRARVFNPNLRLNVPWEKNYRNTMGKGFCHVADVHRYKPDVVESWYSDADLETDTVLFLYEQTPKDVARGFALVYSANRDKQMPGFDQFFDRLAIVDVEQKTDKNGNKVARAPYEFFRKKGNRKKFWQAIARCALDFDPSLWPEKYEREQIRRGQMSRRCPNDLVCELLRNRLKKKEHYTSAAVMGLLKQEFPDMDFGDTKSTLMARCMEYERWHRTKEGVPVWYAGEKKMNRTWSHDDHADDPHPLSCVHKHPSVL